MRNGTRFSTARLACLTFLCLSLALIGGCGSGVTVAPPERSAPVLIANIGGKATDAGNAIAAARKAIAEITAETLAVNKAVALAKMDDVAADVAAIVAAVPEAKKAATASEATIVSQQKELDAKPNPVKVWLNLVGLFLLIGGIGILIASYFVAFLAGPNIEGMAVAAIIMGLSLLTIAYFLTALMFIVGGCILAALVGGAFYLWTHRAVQKEQ